MGATALTDRSDRKENACKTEESIYGQRFSAHRIVSLNGGQKNLPTIYIMTQVSKPHW